MRQEEGDALWIDRDNVCICTALQNTTCIDPDGVAEGSHEEG
jgi:hypothetical protein